MSAQTSASQSALYERRKAKVNLGDKHTITACMCSRTLDYYTYYGTTAGPHARLLLEGTAWETREPNCQAARTWMLTLSSGPGSAPEDARGLSMPARPLLPLLIGLQPPLCCSGSEGLPPDSLAALLVSLGVLLQLYSCCPADVHAPACAEAVARSAAVMTVLSRACMSEQDAAGEVSQSAEASAPVPEASLLSTAHLQGWHHRYRGCAPVLLLAYWVVAQCQVPDSAQG